MNRCWIMIYFYDRVVMGTYKDNALLLADPEGEAPLGGYNPDMNLCYEIHIFNEEKELCWHRTDEDSYDFTETTDGSEENFFEEKMFIIGTSIKSMANGSVKLCQSGREACLPFKPLKNTDNPLRLVVHHLFDDEGGIKGYRLAGIEGGEF